MISIIPQRHITDVSRKLEEIQIRAQGDELRAAFNLSVAKHDREDLHGFERGDSATLTDARIILGEMERIKENERIFLDWLDVVLDEVKILNASVEDTSGSMGAPREGCEPIREALAEYRKGLAAMEALATEAGVA